MPNFEIIKRHFRGCLILLTLSFNLSTHLYYCYFDCSTCGNTFCSCLSHSILIAKVWYVSSEFPIFPHNGCMDFEYPTCRNLQHHKTPSKYIQGCITTLHFPFLLAKWKIWLASTWWYSPLYHRYESCFNCMICYHIIIIKE